MKHNLENIPEVSLDKVDAFYVTGTQHRDAAGKTNNLKLNLKTLGGGGIDLTDKEALKALWNALQDAIAIVITAADVEELLLEGFTSYKVINTEGFPDETWGLEDLPKFTPKVVGVFKDKRSGEEYQVSSQLILNLGGETMHWEANDRESGVKISLVPEFDGNTATWYLSIEVPA